MVSWVFESAYSIADGSITHSNSSAIAVMTEMTVLMGGLCEGWGLSNLQPAVVCRCSSPIPGTAVQERTNRG